MEFQRCLQWDKQTAHFHLDEIDMRRKPLSIEINNKIRDITDFYGDIAKGFYKMGF